MASNTLYGIIIVLIIALLAVGFYSYGQNAQVIGLVTKDQGLQEQAAGQKMQIDNLTAQNSLLQKQEDYQATQINDLTARNQALQKHADDLNKIINDQTALSEVLQQQANNLSAQINDITTKNQALQQQSNNLNTQVEDLTTQNSDLQQQVNDLNERNRELQDSIDRNRFFTGCTDSDGGRDYYTSGTVYVRDDRATTSYSDVCNGDTLTEWYCDRGVNKYIDYRCPRGCSDGRCQ